MNNISVIVVVYNEEERIEKLCKSFQWSNDFIVVDKSSTDRTREIAKKYTSKVIQVPYSDTGNENRIGLEIAKNEWILTVTASDTLTPSLVEEILRLVNLKEFPYDIILMPYSFYILGINEPYSPWNTNYTNRLAKKNSIITSNSVHEEYNINSKKIYKIPYDKKLMFYHLTHKELDICFERHLRYAKAEVGKYINDEYALKKVKREIVKNIIKLLIKGTFFKGDTGVALSLLYLDYKIQKYLYVWQSKRKLKGIEIYNKIYEEKIFINKD